MPSCVIKSCRNHSGSEKKCQGITFHKFPKTNEVWRNDLIEVIRQCRGDDGWLPSKFSVICSAHFDSSDLYKTKAGLLRIVTYAVPKKLLFEPPKTGEEQSALPTTMYNAVLENLHISCTADHSDNGSHIDETSSCHELSNCECILNIAQDSEEIVGETSNVNVVIENLPQATTSTGPGPSAPAQSEPSGDVQKSPAKKCVRRQAKKRKTAFIEDKDSQNMRAQRYRNAHRDEINKRRRENYRKKLNSQAIASTSDVDKIESADCGEDSNTQMIHAKHLHKISSQTYRDRHREEINRRRRESRKCKQNEVENVQNAQIDLNCSNIYEIVKSTPYKIVETAPYDIEKAAPYKIEETAPYKIEETAPYKIEETAPYEIEETAPYEIEETAPYEIEKAAPYKIEETAPYKIEKAAPYKIEETAPYKIEETAPYNIEETAPYKIAETTPYKIEETAPYEIEKTAPYKIAETTPYKIEETAPYEIEKTAPYKIEETALYEIKETTPGLDIVSQQEIRVAQSRIHDTDKYFCDTSETGERERESELPPCCCCLAAAGPAPAPATDYLDMLSYCFNITYPAELRARATICPECVAKLNEGVRFKRRALECQSLLAALGTGTTQASGVPETRESCAVVYREQDENILIKVEPTDPDDEESALQTVGNTSHSGYDARIHEEYDLSTGNSDQLFQTEDDGDQPVDADTHIASPIFKDTQVTEDTIRAQTCHMLTAFDTRQINNGCKCGKNCFKLFCQSEIVTFRRQCQMYQNLTCNTHHMEIFLTGILACIADRSTPKVNVKFRYRNVPVCEEFFKYIFAVTETQYNTVITRIVDGEKYKWMTRSSAEHPSAIKFLQAYSMQNSLVLPGRFSNTHPDLHILPRNVTKSSLYSEYAKVCVANKKRCINQIVWEQLWEQYCPYIVSKIPSDLCKTCRGNNKRLIEAVMFKALNTKLLQECYDHLQLVSDEREFYERSMSRPIVGGGTLNCSFDFLQRFRLPHEPLPGPINFLDAYGVALFAVACQPPSETVVYVVPERVGDDGRNILLSLLHHFLESNASSDVQWHCGPLVRAECVLQYAAWRGRAGSCRLAFLPPGHDHRPDCLALLKIALRSRPARCIQDLCAIISSTGVTAIPVASETGDLNIPIYDWLSYFEAKNPTPLTNIQDYGHFETDTSVLGAFKCKVSAASEVYDLKTVFKGSLWGAPEVMLPAELSEQRRQYLEQFQTRMDESEVMIEYHPNEALDPLEFIKEEIKMEIQEHDIE